MNIRGQARKILRWSEILGLTITLVLLPIDRFPYLHHIPFSLGLISAVLLLIAVVGRLTIVIAQNRFESLKRHLLIGLLLLLPVAGYQLSAIWAIDRHFAEGATVILAAVAFRAYAFYLLLSEVPAYWRLVRKTLYALTAAVVAFGFFQFFLDVWGASPHVTDLRRCCTSNSTYIFPRVHSTALEPLYFDHFLMIPLWLMSFDFLRNRRLRRDKRFLVLFVATATLFILTIARSATIGLIIAGVIFYFGARGLADFRTFLRFIAKLWGTAVVAAVLLVLMSGVATIFINKQAQYKSKFGVELFGGHFVDVNDKSAQTRYKLWPKAIGYFEEQPLHGVGPDNSRIRLNLKDYKKHVRLEKLQPFNNDLIGLVVDLGLLALIAFGPLLALLVYALIKLFKSAWAATIAPLALSLIGMLVQGNFFQSILLTRTWVVIGIVLVMFGPLKGKLDYGTNRH
jgi:hypothetical protein